MSDTTTLESIFSGRGDSAPSPEPVAVETPVAEAPQPEPEAPTEPTPEPQPQGNDPAMVPVAALKGEREKVKRYTEEVLDLRKRIDEVPNQIQGLVQQAIAEALKLQQPQPQQPQQAQSPDFWESPEAALEARDQRLIAQHIAPVIQQVTHFTEQASRREATRAHGEETVNAAYDTLAERVKSDPVAQVEYRRIMASGDPWGNLVQWYDKQPERLEARIRAQVLEEIKQQGHLPVQPQSAAAAPAVMPSDLADARSAASRSGPAYGGPPTLNDIFKR